MRRPGGDQPIILIHGYADSWYSFKGVMDFLPQNFAVFAPSLLGHGRSSKPKQAYPIEGYADNVLEFMHLMGVEKAAVVGHSMGSFVAQCMALSKPDRVSGLVLIGSAVTADNSALRSVHEETLGFEDPVSSDFVWGFQGGTCVGPVDSSMSMEDIVNESSLLPAHVWSSALKGLIDYRPADFDGRVLRSLETPTLVLGGCMDEIFVEAAQRKLADMLPNSEIWLDALCGHSPNWEKSQRTAAQIAKFLDGGG
ncbi:alpha/beta fold hydrolase [Rhizobium ruizarguesonis]